MVPHVGERRYPQQPDSDDSDDSDDDVAGSRKRARTIRAAGGTAAQDVLGRQLGATGNILRVLRLGYDMLPYDDGVALAAPADGADGADMVGDAGDVDAVGAEYIGEGGQEQEAEGVA